ncbi:hypothetical protein LCGC14_0542300 [marine sediment metagenome]|uniref:Uncharacterized protein n=1 Tax=marine sediment metagenome TaxID=412755 RepID=A0A0F9RSG8_9ZZZZ
MCSCSVWSNMQAFKGIGTMFEYDNGVLVCKKHRTPAQKNADGFWCAKCSDESLRRQAMLVGGCVGKDADRAGGAV